MSVFTTSDTFLALDLITKGGYDMLFSGRLRVKPIFRALALALTKE